MRSLLRHVANFGAVLGLLYASVIAGGQTQSWRLAFAPPDDVAGLTEYLRQAKLINHKVPGYLEAYLWWLEQRAGADGRIDWEQRRRGLEEKRRLRPAAIGRRGTQTVQGVWEFVGPKQMTVPYRQYFGQGVLTGRVNAMAVHPTNPSIWYVGAASGGLWKTTNSGTSWTCLSDKWPTLAVSSIAIHPTNGNIIYVGTGDAHGKPFYSGAGVMKSTDGGTTWTRVFAGTEWGESYSEILIHPDFPNTVYAASVGFAPLMSSDAGATWKTMEGQFSWGLQYLELSPPLSNGRRLLFGVLLNSSATDSKVAYAWDRALGASLPNQFVGAWQATGAGVQGGRGDIAASHQEPGVVYVLDGYRREIHRLSFVLRADGLTVERVDETNVTAGFPNGNAALGANYNWSQAFYDWHITCADVSGSERVFVGLIDLVQSGDRGATWQSVGQTYTPGALTHNDQHCLTPLAGGALVGNDGGVYRLTQGGGAWSFDTTLNGTLGITQFYHAGYHPTEPSVMLGGAQDNGSPASTGNTDAWSCPGGGDGGQVAVDPRDGETEYLTTIPSTLVVATADRWTTQTDISPMIGGKSFGTEVRGFVAPMLVHPANPDRLFVGTQWVWRREAATGVWTRSNTQLATNNDYVTAIAGAPTDANRVFAGTRSGGVWTSTDGGATWTRLDSWPATGEPLLPVYRPWITSISVHPSLPSQFVLTANFTSTQFANIPPLQRVWRYDGGWTPVTGTRAAAHPNIQANWICRDPWDPEKNWFSATDAGVFETKDGGATWLNATEPLGLPNVQVNHIEAVPGTGYLMAATYGRGIWRIGLKPPVRYAVSGRVTVDGQGLAGVTLRLRGPDGGERSTLSASDGTFRETDLEAGAYTVTPVKQHFTFTPASRNVSVGPDAANVNFTAAHVRYKVSGRVTLGAGGLDGVAVAASGPGGTANTTTAADGTYTLTGLKNGDYTVTPTRSGHSFTPASRSVSVAGDVSGVDFTAQAAVFQIRGTVRQNGAGLSSVLVTAQVGEVLVTVVTGPKGAYVIPGLVASAYTVTPSRKGLTFTPASNVVVLGPTANGIDFTAQPDQPPAAPTQLQVLSATKTSLALIWLDNSENESEFQVEQKKGAAWQLVGSVPGDVEATVITGLKRNKKYSFRVRALNAAGGSAYSNIAKGKTKAR